jgi:hypothetical protein
VSASGRWRVVVQPRTPVHVHPIDVVRAVEGDVERGRARSTSWIVVLYRDERRVFDSRGVSIELTTERGARWLAHVVRRAIDADVFAPPREDGVPPPHREPIVWARADGDADDCVHGAYAARVTQRAGVVGWVALVRHGELSVFHSVDLAGDVRLRTLDAGRFVAELALDLAIAGQRIPAASSLP